MRFFVMLSGGIIRVSALNASDVEQGIAADLKELAFSHIREKPTIWQSAHRRGISHRRTVIQTSGRRGDEVMSAEPGAFRILSAEERQVKCSSFALFSS
jgi:hypothetical protein